MAQSVRGFPAPLYYGEPADLADASTGSELTLTGPEARHAASVRRVRVGERISVGDGDGRVAFGPVTRATQTEVVIAVEAVVEIPVGLPQIVLVQALAKGDRDELAIQAATEVGVDRIVPWAAARSVSQWNEAKREKAHARWVAIVREAAKQSLRATVPVVEPLAGLAGVRAAADAVIVLDPAGTAAFADAVRDASTGTAARTSADATTAAPTSAEPDGHDGASAGAGVRSLAIVVGPEGGIDPAEIDALVAAGARVAILGDTVLRTSTAGPVAIAIAQTVLGRWGSTDPARERTVD